MDKRKIGIFDSGIGGLTVLDDLVSFFPNEDFLYLADTYNFPYGIKTDQEIEEIVRKNIDYLIKEGVKLIVIACNTASSHSYGILKTVPIIRIIEPTIQYANKAQGNMLVIATNSTIDTGVYKNIDNKQIFFEKCSEFVEIVENGLSNTAMAYEVVGEKLEKYIGKVDNIVLGCTHFGLLEKVIRDIFKKINIIDSAKCLKESVAHQLQEIDAFNDLGGRIDLVATKDVSKLNIAWFEHKISAIKEIKF